MSFKTSVIISTDTSSEWLEMALWGYGNQSYRGFQVIVADNGSDSETVDVVRDFQKNSGMTIDYLQHGEDDCQRSFMLNKAIKYATGDYLIFVDGDCVPRKDFVDVHRRSARPNHFLSGGHTNLPMCCSVRVDKDAVLTGDLFDIVWLQQNGYPDTAKRLRLILKQPLSGLFNLIPTQNNWNGHNASGWKENILRVNGFDERIKHGSECYDLGERLKHSGIKTKRIRYTAVSVHLSHKPDYINGAHCPVNIAIRNDTMENRVSFTPFGILQDGAYSLTDYTRS